MQIKIIGYKEVPYNFNGKEGISHQAYYVDTTPKTKNGNVEYGMCPNKFKIRDIGIFGLIESPKDIINRQYEVYFDRFGNVEFAKELGK